MKILVFNTDKNLNHELKLLVGNQNFIYDNNSNFPRVDGVFINWIPTTDKPSDSKRLVRQVELIEYYVKRHNIIVFDSDRGLTPTEIKYLTDNNSVLLEPAIITREHFKYQPHWLRIPNKPTDLSLNPFENKTKDVGFFGNMKTRFNNFEKVYKEVHDILDCSVVLSPNFFPTRKKMEYESFVQFTKFKLQDVKLSILIGNEEEYNKGFLDKSFVTCLNNGIVPTIPQDHKWYYNLFEGLVIKNTSDVKYLLKVCNNTNFGWVWGILEKINEYHPNMRVDNTAKRIIKLMEK